MQIWEAAQTKAIKSVHLENTKLEKGENKRNTAVLLSPDSFPSLSQLSSLLAVIIKVCLQMFPGVKRAICNARWVDMVFTKLIKLVSNTSLNPNPNLNHPKEGCVYFVFSLEH